VEEALRGNITDTAILSEEGPGYWLCNVTGVNESGALIVPAYLELLLGSLNRLQVIASPDEIGTKQSKPLNGGLDYEIASSGSLAGDRDKPRNDT